MIRYALALGFAMFTASALGCGIGVTVTVTDPLPPVDAMDDAAATSVDVPVSIFVLANDEQDDDLVTDLTDPVDDMSNFQVGAAEIDFFNFPERIIYTPPPGFVGTVTFDYDITALGTQYDYTTTDTATVTVTVRAGLPDVVAVDDRAFTDVDQAVVIDVLLNDSRESDQIDGFSQAFDRLGNEQMGSVSLQITTFDELVYTPPLGFMGAVTIDYDIVGTGITHFAGSMDTGQVDVRVSPLTASILQFADLSAEVFEILEFFVTQADIDINFSSADLFAPGEVTDCIQGPVGLDIALQARLTVNNVVVVDGSCNQLAAGLGYTIVVQPGFNLDPLEVVCLPFLLDPSQLSCP